MRLPLLLAILVGCGTARDGAVRALNVAHSTDSAAVEQLRVLCVEPYKRAASMRDVEKLDSFCLRARRAFGVFRKARLTALAAMLASEATGDGTALPGRIVDLAVAGDALANELTKGSP